MGHVGARPGRRGRKTSAAPACCTLGGQGHRHRHRGSKRRAPPSRPPLTQPAARASPQLVHSRTFGSAAKEGGIGVRMLVPLIDMLNHAGDEAQLLLDSPATATDNVR